MNDEEIKLEQEAFENIQNFLKSKGNHNFELNLDEEGITLENEKVKYRIEKNHIPLYEGSYKLKIFKDNIPFFFDKRPNGSTYDELYIKLADML